MWIAVLGGWIIGSALLYYFLVASAQEPKYPECMECHLTDCHGCPLAATSSQDYDVEQAA